MRRRLLVLLPLVVAAALVGACGGGESDTPEAAGGARLTINYPSDVTLQAVAEIYGRALEKAGVAVKYSEKTAGDLSFDTRFKAGVLDSVAPRVNTPATPALRAEIDRISKALSSEELAEIHEQTDPKEEDHITPAVAAERWLGLNGF